MIKFLFIIILFFVALFVIVPSVIFGIIRFLLNMLGGTSSGRGGYRQGGHGGTATGGGAATENDAFEYKEESKPRAKRKKVFDDDEGEYVSFEEIKSSDDKK